MQINCDNRMNYTGTYRFPKVNSNLKSEIKSLVHPNDCVIASDVKKPGDMVISANNDYDLKISKFIERKNLGFEFFPNIRLSENLNKKNLTFLVRRDIKNGDTVTRTGILRMKLLETRPSIDRQKEYMRNAIKTLRLNVEAPKVGYSDRGYMKIRDDVKGRTLHLGHIHNGRMYLAVVPDSKHESVGRYYLNRKGKQLLKTFESPQDIKDFKEIACIDF